MFVDASIAGSGAPTKATRLSLKRLGLSERELEALLWVREELDSGSLKYNRQYIACRGFNMNGFNLRETENRNCNTTHCIGGWMAIRLKLRGEQAGELFHRGKLHQLFFPTTDAEISTRAAVLAIDHFLDTGRPAWHTAVKREPSDER